MHPELIVTNLKKRYTGVSGTINALMPVQSQKLAIGFVGQNMPGVEQARKEHPDTVRHLGLGQAIALSLKHRISKDNPRKIIWHVRRDHEMMIAIFLRDVLRAPISIVFTSAAKHRHSFFPRWLIRQMDAVIATTPAAASFLGNTTSVVYHGASLTRFKPPENQHTVWQESGLPGKYGIGVFGRIRPSKGTDIFVDAMIQVLPHHPDFTAIITGDCLPQHQSFKNGLIQKIKANHLESRIVFLGNLPPEEIPLWYQRVLIMVACPRYEPFGITPLEAMASECAVVASATGAFEDIVQEDQTGYVVPTDDANALAHRVGALMQDPEFAVQMGKAGHARVTQHFSIEHEAAGIQAVYDQLWNKDLQLADG
ncbi:MAG: glycosyltransferase family 4 protein [Brachymonas sp.]|nr:glycosyltransferase family 4 protein [Brachymonas sp.]